MELTMDLNELIPMPSAPQNADVETYIPENVCPKMIKYSVEDGKLKYLNFVGGCDGNLKALSSLLTDMDLDVVIDKLSGITCGQKTTSCVDQLCNALRELEDS